MFQPKFQILIQKENFNDNFICLGSQLITIINFLKDVLLPHIWYAADIDVLGETLIDYSFFLKKIGDDSILIDICAKIDQFLSGIFVAIDNRILNPNIEQIEVGTEDKRFRSLPLDGVLIEIRAFDTSFFEIYTEDEGIIKKLANKFNVTTIGRREES